MVKNTQEAALKFLTQNLACDVTAHAVQHIRFKVGVNTIDLWDAGQKLGHVHTTCAKSFIDMSELVDHDYLVRFLEANGAIRRSKVPAHF